MKKLMLSLVVLAMSATTVFAQCPTKAGKCDAPKTCADKTAQCADRLVQEMKLDDATAQWFKPLFAEYQQKLADVRAKYCNKDKKDCKNCTDAEIMKHLEGAIACQGDIADVKSAYLKKFKAKLNAKQLQVIFCQKKMKAGKHPMARKHFGKKHGKACNMKHGKCDKDKKCDKHGAKKCDKHGNKKCDKTQKCDKAGEKKCDAPKCDKTKK
jgi:hypothetical protein